MKENKPQYIIVHHTGGTNANPLADTSHHTFAMVNNWHKQKWHFESLLGYYIGYHYFIDKSGKITQGRDDLEEGAHAIGYNTSSIGVCLAGNFDATYPTKEQEESLKKLLIELVQEYNIPVQNIIPHRLVANKTCYGRNLSDTWARKIYIKGKLDGIVKVLFSILEKLKGLSS